MVEIMNIDHLLSLRIVPWFFVRRNGKKIRKLFFGVRMNFFRLNNVELIPLCPACKSVLHNLRVWPSYRPQDPTICIRWILGHQQSAWLYFFRPIPSPFISLNYQILFFFVPYFPSLSSFFLSLFVSTSPSFLLKFKNDFFSIREAWKKNAKERRLLVRGECHYENDTVPVAKRTDRRPW